MKVISVEQMRLLDFRTIEAGTSGEFLMEKAGLGAFILIQKYIQQKLHKSHCRKFTVLAGKGNNGGDAYVVARHLALAGHDVHVYSVCERVKLKGEAFIMAEHLRDVPVTICNSLPESALTAGTIVVDGLLGTGFKGKLREPYSTWIKQVNSADIPVVSLDIPSGLNGDTGTIEDCAIVADLTITIGLPKAGLFRSDGCHNCGSVEVVDIGIPEEFIEQQEQKFDLFTRIEARKLLKRRNNDAYKYKFGKCLVAGGSIEYAGAPVIAAEAALRSGTGMVYLYIPEAAQTAGITIPKSIISRKVSGDYWNGKNISEIKDLDKAGVIVFGPGIGNSKTNLEALEQMLLQNTALVLDAEALKILPKAALALRSRAACSTVLTPHTGEMRDLYAGLKMNIPGCRIEQAKQLAWATNSVVVLKGKSTVIAKPDGTCTVNNSGNNGLAVAGTGDALSGIIAAFIAQDMNTYDAACLGCFLHGYTADKSISTRYFTSDDIISGLEKAFYSLTPFA